METVVHESMKKPFLRSRKPQKMQKRLEKDIQVGWGNGARKFKSWTLSNSLFRRFAPYTETK